MSHQLLQQQIDEEYEAWLNELSKQMVQICRGTKLY